MAHRSWFPEVLNGTDVVLRRHVPGNMRAFQRWYADPEVVRLTRYQDGPDISFLKVQHELALHDNQPPDEALLVTDSELAAYRSAHEKQPGRRARPAVPSESAPR